MTIRRWLICTNNKCRHKWIAEILSLDEKKELRRKRRTWDRVVCPKCKKGKAELWKGKE